MKTLSLSLLLIFAAFVSSAQTSDNLPDNLKTILKADDVAALTKIVTKENVNDCYGNYSLLSQTIRYKAPKCFDLMIATGADVNKVCNEYVPPLFHAAKYGTLDMVKVLVTRGANVNYTYTGEYEPANGKTPLTYAEENNQPGIVDYLRTFKK